MRIPPGRRILFIAILLLIAAVMVLRVFRPLRRHHPPQHSGVSNFRSMIVGLALALLAACAPSAHATWPPGGVTPSPITAQKHLPGSRFVPSTRRWNLVWADQLIPDNISVEQLRFAAEHYAATQKIFSSQAAQFRAIQPNFLVVMYHLAAGLNPEHNDDCPNPKTNHGTGNIGVVAPAGFVGEYRAYFRPWLTAHSITEGDSRFEAMFQHYDSIDSTHRVWHQDPAWLMNMANADWRMYLGDECLNWMQGNQDDGCFFDVAVETNSSLYNPKIGNPSPGNFDWWAPPHGPAGEAAQTTDRTAFAAWMNKRYLGCYQDIYRRFHTAALDQLVIPNTDQMVTTVYDPSWTDGDASGETIDGAMMEGFGSWRGQDMWLTLDRGVRHITGRGKILIAQFYGVDSVERLRRTAMYMLIKNENSFLNILNGNGVEWYPEYEIDLGDQHPLPRTLDSLRIAGQGWQSVWAREYDRGRVLCNTSDAAITVDVPPGAHWVRIGTSGGGNVSSSGTELPQSISYEPVSGRITVPASGGVILYRVDSAAAVNEAPPPVLNDFAVAPNPAFGTASITFTLARASRVRLCLTTAIGQEIQTITDGTWSAGEHRLAIPYASQLSPGAYFVRLGASDGARVARFNVVR